MSQKLKPYQNTRNLNSWRSPSFAFLLFLAISISTGFAGQHRSDKSNSSGNPEVKTNKNLPTPDYENQQYGSFKSDVLDFWKAKSDQPAPLLVFTHGGGFAAGDKRAQISARTINECIKSGISVASINYRLSAEAIAPAAHYDEARAVQFLRSKAKEWNWDSTRICVAGGSAGAGMSLWIGFHDDLADPKSEDPIARESTRVTCIAVYNAQTSYDPRFIKKLLRSDAYKVGPLMVYLGLKGDQDVESPTSEKIKLFEEISPVNYLTADDPPVFITYAKSCEMGGIHSPKFGTYLKEKMDALHIECTILQQTPQYGPEQMAFIKKHLGVSN